MRISCDYSEGAVVQRLIPWSRNHFTRSVVLGSLPFGYAIFGGGRVLLCYGLKLAFGYFVSKESWEGLWGRPMLAAACVLPGCGV